MNVPAKVSLVAITLAVFALASSPSFAQERDQVTPSHVYQAVQELISEIHLLRDAMGVVDFPPEAEPQEDRAPVHVYAKSLEVMEKIARSQRRLGMTPGKVGQIPVREIQPKDVPVKEIQPKDVLGSVQAAIREIHRTKDQLVIEDQITPTTFEGGKTPSDNMPRPTRARCGFSSTRPPRARPTGGCCGAFPKGRTANSRPSSRPHRTKPCTRPSGTRRPLPRRHHDPSRPPRTRHDPNRQPHGDTRRGSHDRRRGSGLRPAARSRNFRRGTDGSVSSARLDRRGSRGGVVAQPR